MSESVLFDHESELYVAVDEFESRTKQGQTASDADSSVEERPCP